LVTDPQIIFLDEPTSGLDSFNALNVVSMLKTFAQAQNKIVLMTIHQPRTDIVNLLDNIIVLSMGKCIWFGQNGPALKHFASLGFPLPEQTNASDFYLDISTYDGRTEESQQVSIARVDKFANAFQYSETLPAKKDSLQSRVTQWPSTWLKELNVLTQRSMVDVLRDKPTMFANFGQTLILTVT
jgi:ABC-type multidrug transport system ATPase subunit